GDCVDAAGGRPAAGGNRGGGDTVARNGGGKRGDGCNQCGGGPGGTGVGGFLDCGGGSAFSGWPPARGFAGGETTGSAGGTGATDRCDPRLHIASGRSCMVAQQGPGVLGRSSFGPRFAVLLPAEPARDGSPVLPGNDLSRRSSPH